MFFGILKNLFLNRIHFKKNIISNQLWCFQNSFQVHSKLLNNKCTRQEGYDLSIYTNSNQTIINVRFNIIVIKFFLTWFNNKYLIVTYNMIYRNLHPGWPFQQVTNPGMCMKNSSSTNINLGFHLRSLRWKDKKNIATTRHLQWQANQIRASRTLISGKI